MTPRRSVFLQFMALGLAIVVSLGLIPLLRERVPIHWDFHGRPDAWGSPTIALLFGPLSIGFVLVATFFLANRTGPMARPILPAMGVLAVFFLGIHGLLLGAAILHAFFPIRLLLALTFGLFAGVAPTMAKVEQNPWFGIRTPWTLGSRRVWRDTHAATARLWLVGGIAGALLTVLGLPLALMTVYMIGLTTYPILISYRVWRKSGRP